MKLVQTEEMCNTLYMLILIKMKVTQLKKERNGNVGQKRHYCRSQDTYNKALPIVGPCSYWLISLSLIFFIIMRDLNF
jgi:hypothetical protein